MKAIPFVQFLRPDGRQTHIVIDRSDAIGDKAAEMRQHGWRFEIEELMNGMVSMTIEDDDVEDRGAIAHEICYNGPAVLNAVDTLIATAYKAFQRERERANAS